MIFSLDVRRARKGDALLLHFGSKQKPGLAMIDGGPKAVYQPHVRPRLAEIKQARGLGPQQPLPIDLLMVSHVDDDHIQGILDFTRELRDAAPGQAPFARVLRLWHNTFDDVIGNTPGELTASVEASIAASATKGGLPDDAEIDIGPDASEEEQEIAESTLLVLSSIEQGHRLRDDAAALGWQLNPPDRKLILLGKQMPPIAEGLAFTIAGPTVAELKALQKKHDQWLKTRKGKKPEAVLAAYVDKSVPNLSSIVTLAESGGKKILLTGDARGDMILKGLESAGVMPKGGKLRVDLLKVPHHGSSNNVDQDFYDRIIADNYVFSGNGEHGNPERESMEMLFKARGKEAFQVHLTYPIDQIDAARKAEWEKQQEKEKKRKAKKKRPNWSAPKQTLAVFFDRLKLAAGQKIQIVDEKKPHVIDLLEPLGY